jgi:hypothetical protein
VIHATRQDAGAIVDSALTEVSRHLHEEPFARFNSFKLLDRKRLPIGPGKTVADPLANGRTLQVELVDVVDRAGDKRFHLRAAIDQPGKEALLKLLEVTASANEPFFVGGQAFRGGTLFIEIAIRP